MVKTVIIGFDSTESAHRAVDYALAHNDTPDLYFHLVYVIKPLAFYKKLSAPKLGQRDTDKDAARAIVEPAAARIRNLSRNASWEVRRGRPAHVLHAVCEEREGHHIYIGRKRSTGFFRSLTHNTIGELALLTNHPITLVP